MSNLPSHWTRNDDAFVEAAMRRGASRRELLQGLLAGGVAASAAGGILGRSRAAVAATPRSGGNLKIATATISTADTLDPARATNATDYTRCCSVYNRLTNLDGNSQVVMELADSIDTTDAKVWTIKLRKGVTFHSGQALSSADVIYSLKRHLDPATGSKVNGLAKQMTGFRAVDDQTAEVTLAAANADLPTILALHHFMIVADNTTDFSKGNGTGAFVVETFEPGVRTVMRKNKSYWKADGPYVDTVELIAISDDTARVNALLSGDIHIAAAINPRALRLIEGKPGFSVSRSSVNNYTDLNMRLDMAPGDKADFVAGMKSLVNREQILRAALRGQGTLGNDQPVYPGNVYRDNDVKPMAFDPDKAKFHFNKAGVLGTPIPMVASEVVGSSVDMAMIIQSDAAQIGMKIDVQRVPSDGYWDKFWLKAPIHFGNVNYRPTPDILFSLFYASTAPWNESRYKSEKFDAMLGEARGLLDQAKRKEMYGEMQRMVSTEAGTVIPAYISGLDATTSKLKGMEQNPLGGMIGYTVAEHVWFES